MSKTFVGSAVCPEFESEAPAAEEMLDRVVCMQQRTVQQMCLESDDLSGSCGTFRNWRVVTESSFQTAGAVILNALDWKMILVAG